MADRSEQRVVGVYPDEASAQDAAQAAQESGGSDVEVGAPEDEVAALMGEMREETEHAWVGPGVPGPTKEMARSAGRWTVIGALLGVALALAVNFLGGGDLELGTRLLIAIPVGLVTGGTIGFLVGGGFFDPRRKAASNLAAEEGVVVGADEPADGEATDRALAEHDPIRVDRVDAGGPVGTVTTEDRQRR